MKGLFVNTDFVKLAYTTPVSQDPAQWPKQALNEFLAQFPEFTNEDLQVQLTKKEPDKGYAVGAIMFKKGTVAVPIIIKEFGMFTFDVIVAANKIMPLTRENLFSLFSNKQAYGTLAPIDTAGNFVSMFDPALRAAAGEYSMNMYSVKAGSASEDYSFIDRLSNSTSAKIKQAILSLIESDLEANEAFKKNKTYDVIEKIATLKENDKIDVKNTLSHALGRDIHYIYKSGSDEYTGIFGSTEAFDPVIVKMTKDEFKEFTPIKLAKCSEKKNEKEKKKKKIAVFSIVNDKINKLVLSEDAKYAEFTPNDEFLHGSLEKRGMYEPSELKFDGVMPEAGKKYILKLGNEVTRPWDVIRTTFMGGKFTVDVFDGLEKHSYMITKGIQGIHKHETQKNAHYISDSIDWIEISGKLELEQPKIELKDSVTRVSDDFYRFEGPNLRKYASDYNYKPNLSFHEAAWCLIQSRADIDTLKKFSELKPGQKAEFGSLHVPPSLSKFAELIQNEYDNIFEKDYGQIAYLHKLVKIAADNPLKTTVDAVLSLGFINKENIEEYIAQIPMYEQVCSDLAKLLLYARLGMESVNEEPVRKAMIELTKVVERLRGLAKLTKVE